MRVVLGAIPAGRTLKLAEYALTMIGALALGYCLAVFLEAKFYQAREERAFARELRLKEGNKATPVDSIAAVATPDKHGVVGRLEIPRLGVSVMVVEGVDDSDLKHAVGHILRTALPWESGNGNCRAQRHIFPASALDPA